jgi:hypothetical protein
MNGSLFVFKLIGKTTIRKPATAQSYEKTQEYSRVPVDPGGAMIGA